MEEEGGEFVRTRTSFKGVLLNRVYYVYYTVCTSFLVIRILSCLLLKLTA